MTDEVRVPLRPERITISSPSGIFKWSPDEIDEFMRAADVQKLEDKGGAEGISEALKSDLKNGLSPSDNNWEERIKLYVENSEFRFRFLVSV